MQKGIGSLDSAVRTTQQFFLKVLSILQETLVNWGERKKGGGFELITKQFSLEKKRSTICYGPLVETVRKRCKQHTSSGRRWMWKEGLLFVDSNCCTLGTGCTQNTQQKENLGSDTTPQRCQCQQFTGEAHPYAIFLKHRKQSETFQHMTHLGSILSSIA